MLYRGKEDSLRKASRFTGQGDWNQAFNIWNILSETGDNTCAAKALNNMAIYYELEDNLDSASFMVDRALAYDTLEVVENYREELEIRILNQKEVIDQVY